MGSNLRESGAHRTDHVSEQSFHNAVQALYERSGTMSYYEILGVDQQATGDEIKKAFVALTHQFHPDKHHAKDSDDLGKKLNVIFSSITEAYSTLSQPAKRQQYDRDLVEQASRAATANLTKEQRAEILCADGHEKMQERQYEEAERLFSQAIYLDGSNPVYHYSLARVYIENRQFTEGARILEKAIKLNPMNAHYHAALGHAFIEIGLPKRARGCFERSLRIQPDNKSALEGLKKAAALL